MYTCTVLFCFSGRTVVFGEMQNKQFCSIQLCLLFIVKSEWQLFRHRADIYTPSLDFVFHYRK